MGIGQVKDIENGEINGQGDLEKPLIVGYVKDDDEAVRSVAAESGSIWKALLCTFVAVCGSFEFGSCVGYSAPTQSAITEDLNLSLAQFSMFGSIVTIGAMLGAVKSGRIADLIGRKGAMRISAGICIAGWFAVYFSKGPMSLDVGRFSTGYGIGAFSYVVPIYMAEIAPKNLRGGLTTLNQLMIVTGSSVAFLVGSVISWRALALTGLVPCIILLIGVFLVPESPRWLAKVGRAEEFQIALQKLRGKNADITQEAAEIQLYIEFETLQSLPKARIWDLFQQKYIHSVIIGVALMVFQQFGGINGISFYASETFASASLSSGKIGTITYACVQVPITIVGAMLMNKSGRRPLIMLSAAWAFLGCFMAGTSFYLKAHNLLLGWVPILAVVLGSFEPSSGSIEPSTGSLLFYFIFFIFRFELNLKLDTNLIVWLVW